MGPSPPSRCRLRRSRERWLGAMAFAAACAGSPAAAAVSGGATIGATWGQSRDDRFNATRYSGLAGDLGGYLHVGGDGGDDAVEQDVRLSIGGGWLTNPFGRRMVSTALLAGLILQAGGPPHAAVDTATTRKDWPLGVGGQLMVTYEPDGPNAGALAANVLPLVVHLQTPMGAGLHLTTIANYQLGGDDKGFTNLGGSLTVPIYLGHDGPTPGAGFYVGPNLGASWNLINEGAELTAAAEGGVRWMLGDHLALRLALQIGATYFTDAPGGKGWTFHPGVYPSLIYFFHDGASGAAP